MRTVCSGIAPWACGDPSPIPGKAAGDRWSIPARHSPRLPFLPGDGRCRQAPLGVIVMLSCAASSNPLCCPPVCTAGQPGPWRRRHSLPPGQWLVGAPPADGAGQAGHWPPGHTGSGGAGRVRGRGACGRCALSSHQLLWEPHLHRVSGRGSLGPFPLGLGGADVKGGSPWSQLLPDPEPHPGPGSCAQTTGGRRAWTGLGQVKRVRRSSLIADFIPKRCGAGRSLSTWMSR